jgi:molecular chaperone GrpE
MTTPPTTADVDEAGEDPAAEMVAPANDLQTRAEQAEDQWRRAAADLDNLQKRFGREVARERSAERERVMLLWLAMLDDLERSVAYANRPEETTGLVDGVEAIVTSAVASIAALGYSRFAEAGDTFDTGLHEVISTVPADADHPVNTIAAVIKAGYGTRDNLLRPASVVVAADAD